MLLIDVLQEWKPKFEQTQSWDRIRDDNGYAICLLDGNTGKPMIHQTIGILNEESLCMEVAYEKSKRIYADALIISSYETRDVTAGKWGGGVRCDQANYILAISGFTEVIDEVFAIRLGEKLNLISENRRNEILKMSSSATVYAKLIS